MVEESGPHTPSKWAITFYVNLRREKQNYKVNDFRTSNLKICDYTSDLDKILFYLNAIPSIAEMVQGTVSLFRDNIENIWEDPKNEGGQILRFTCCKKECAMDQQENAYKPRIPLPSLQADRIEDLWNWLCSVILSSTLESLSSTTDNRMVNGIYCKVAKEGIVSFEIWCGSSRQGDKGKPIEKVQNFLTKVLSSATFNEQDTATNVEYKNAMSSLCSTLKVIEIPGPGAKPRPGSYTRNTH